MIALADELHTILFGLFMSISLRGALEGPPCRSSNQSDEYKKTIHDGEMDKVSMNKNTEIESQCHSKWKSTDRVHGERKDQSPIQRMADVKVTPCAEVAMVVQIADSTRQAGGLI